YVKSIFLGALLLITIVSLQAYWGKWCFFVLSILVLSSLIYFFIKKQEKNISEREVQKTEIEKLKSISYQHQLEIEKVINFFSYSMSKQKTTEDMLWDVTRNCISKLGFEDCVIYLIDEEKNVLLQKAAWGPKTTEENKILNPIEIPVGKGIVGHVALTGKAEIINDTSEDSRYIIDDQQRNAELSVPLLQEGKVMGVIDCEHSEKYFYTNQHLQILETVAALCADRLEKMKAEKESHTKEIRLVELNRNLVTSQLTALRAQMNPHFIFNALNSIQQYILTGDVDQANKYLSKFSRLQREVLNHCDQNFITLEKEIEMLQLYLQLEQLRFNENFEYQISCADEIDCCEIKIPPMILQPFIENAIWHGLMPKDGHKKVNIRFSLLSESELLCVIQDNGIGRLAATRLKHNNTEMVQHKSKGLSLVFDRLKILEQQYNHSFKAGINDITDAQGLVLGTEVRLQLFI
ncbi:MAG TPA: histidine kinase, partial [Ferruginibacter sp.]|nr:histidine kinase [Ferruginibacter sp.]